MVRGVRFGLGRVRGRRGRSCLGGAAILALIVGFAAAPSAAQDQPAAPPKPAGPPREIRLALVVGEADYAAGALPTGANDAGLIAQALAQDGFDVTARADADAPTLRKLVRDFTDRVDKAGPDAFVVVYLAGYGLQYGDEDFIAPVDARIDRDADVPVQAVAFTDLFHPLELLPAKARLVVADLAHATPFARDGVKGGAPLAAGLAPRQPPPGTAYAFNAMPGTVAAADPLPYGAYARALAEMMATPGLPLPTMFDRVRLRAGVLTNGADIPWNAGAADATLTFVPPLAQGTPDLGALADADLYSTAIERDTLLGYTAALKAASSDRQAPRLRAILAVSREASFWSASAKADVPRAYWTYMRRYPRGPHLPDARRRLAALRAPLEPPPRFDIMTYDDVPAPTAEEAALVAPPFAVQSFAVLADPAWPPIPLPPPGLLPPPTPAFGDELAPPPLVPAGVLPIPMPTPSAREAARTAGAARRVTQPDVPTYGQVVAETRLDPGGPALALSANGKPLCRVATTSGAAGERMATEVDPAGAVISRITTLRHDGELTILQTGPDGGALTQAVTRSQPDGSRRTILTDGRKAVLATIRSNEAGIVTAATLAPTAQANPPYRPAASGQGPVLAPRLLAAASRLSPPPGSDRAVAAVEIPPAALSAPPPLPPVVFPTTEPPAPPASPPKPAGKPAPVATPAPPPEPAKPSPPEPPRREAARQEPPRPELARKEPARTEPARREPGRKEPVAKPPPAARGKPAKASPRPATRARATPARRPPAVHLKKHR